MLRPAILYKEELEQAIKPFYYTEDMFYFNGCTEFSPINIVNNTDNGQYQFAVIDSKYKVIGYIGFYISKYHSCANRVGVFSFDRHSIVMGRDMYRLFNTLIEKLHRVEFTVIEGNPAIKHYDKFFNKYKDIGRRIKMRDVTKDFDGNYRSEYLYEFINNNII